MNPSRQNLTTAPTSPGQTLRSTRRTHRRGLGLAEMLVALAISAALLSAVAVAVDASFKAYQINQEHSDLTQRARLAVHRITTMIRQTETHAPDNTGLAAEFATGKTVTDIGISMFDLSDPPTPITFRHDVPNRRVIAIVNNVPHTLCEGVEGFAVRMEPMRSAKSLRTGGSWDLLRRVTILITVRSNSETALKGEGVGRQQVTISASVMPRRNSW
jgi:prepilin-type N-terminal cleavage/methylation domain-containing protein